MRLLNLGLVWLATVLAGAGTLAPASGEGAPLAYAPAPARAEPIMLAGPKAQPSPPPPERVCFNRAETRERIATHRLAEFFKALHAGRLQGDALRAKLCRWKQDEFVYEIAVLRHDGRIVHVYMNARNGQNVRP